MVTQAREALREAAMAVALSEANLMAEEVERHEAVALALRARLGGSLSPVGQMPTLTAALRRVISSTDLLGERDDVFAHNGPLWIASKAAAEVWRDHVVRLMTEPDAELNFDAPELVSLAAE
jgi:hypothetical protein